MSAGILREKSTTPILGRASSPFVVAAIRRAAHVFDVLMRIRRNRLAILQLAEADDHMLRDIGLTRADVKAAYHAGPLTDPGRVVRVFSDLK
jgi:uncharacterized protein YjiS (DUF1127 family)